MAKEQELTDQEVNSESTSANKQDWSDLDPKFVKGHDGKVHQQKWEECGFIKTETKEWLAIGFSIYDYYDANYWKNHGFTPQQTKEWTDNGLDKRYDSYLVAYARFQGYQPGQIKKKELEEKYKKWKQANSAQAWLDALYPQSQREKITRLDIIGQNLTGKLVLVDFISLKVLYCSNNQLTELDLTNCKELTEVWCSSNQLTNFNYSTLNPQTLTELSIRNNNLLEQDLTVFSQFTNLETLYIGNDDEDKINQNIYNRWIGSLEPLKYLTKLEELDISNTDLNQGVEYLPSSIKKLDYDTKARPNCKLPAIKEQLDLFKSFFKSGNYQKWVELGFTWETIKPWLEAGLVGDDYKLVNYLKQKGNDPAQGILNAQDWVEGKYSSTERATITEIDISQRKLTGNLDLSEFTNLKELYCYNNQLTNLNLSNCPNLEKLNCSNNQLEDIIFPPDANKIIASEVHIDGNDKLDYAKIDSKFLKYLPILTENKIEAIDKVAFEQIIKEKLSNLDIQEKIDIFPTWWNPNCAIIISKKSYYAVRLVIYEPPKGKMPEIWKIKRFPNQNPLLGYLTAKKANKKATELKEQLNSDNPILVLYSDTNFSPEEIIKTFALPEEAKTNPDQYLKSSDMIWREMEGKISAALNKVTDIKHVAVYLGNKRVAHIGSSKFAKLSSGGISSINPSNVTRDTSQGKAFMGARNDYWDDFLHNTSNLVRYHLIIPFQKPAKIQELLMKAIVSGYGQEEYNFLRNNCEHFATLCVTGVPFSTQADKWVITDRLTELFKNKNLVEVIQNCEEQIIETILVPQEYSHLTPAEHLTDQILETKQKFLTNRKERIKALESKSELTEEEKELLTLYRFEVNSLETDISDASSEISISNRSYNSSSVSLTSSVNETPSLNWWQRLIQKKANIPGTIIQVIPLESNPNQVLVINKVALYAIRLFEYNSQENKLVELKRFAKNKLGYATLEDTQDKVNRIVERKPQAQTSHIEQPPK